MSTSVVGVVEAVRRTGRTGFDSESVDLADHTVPSSDLGALPVLTVVASGVL